MFTRQLEKVACILMAAALLPPTNTSLRASPQTTQSLIEATLDNITNLNRPGQDGYATVWDGNKYVSMPAAARPRPALRGGRSLDAVVPGACAFA
jgi:hypothetical protein